ncbi:STAS domain-containing protein [Amycolatopsis cihanbeyliensis]|uniref:Anti-sigma factor antagonist n=1 Tax=Amycolatopsis cihanbeyliensis TaxID=1128664 RepID=A0A542DEA2_AMYCI|nr:STAS domain-containing protein [Amycolatopsis cihanbeyliensis]TQJ01404.1 anti-sigma B factor antagonist [Amycolatopsis cihanbeyliensis]
MSSLIGHQPCAFADARRHGRVGVVHVNGDIDLATADTVRRAIGGELATDPAALVIDLSSVEFFGSTGLSILADTRDATRGRVRLGVVATQHAVLRPLRLFGFCDSIPVHTSLREALEQARRFD